jgi:hypothetical protein
MTVRLDHLPQLLPQAEQLVQDGAAVRHVQLEPLDLVRDHAERGLAVTGGREGGGGDLVLHFVPGLLDRLRQQREVLL